jgi:protease-4
MSREAVLKASDGRLFTGRQAKALGLVDLLGTYEDAIAVAGEMTGLGSHPPTVKEGAPSRWEALMNRLDSEITTFLAPRISMRYTIF